MSNIPKKLFLSSNFQTPIQQPSTLHFFTKSDNPGNTFYLTICSPLKYRNRRPSIIQTFRLHTTTELTTNPLKQSTPPPKKTHTIYYSPLQTTMSFHTLIPIAKTASAKLTTKSSTTTKSDAWHEMTRRNLNRTVLWTADQSYCLTATGVIYEIQNSE